MTSAEPTPMRGTAGPESVQLQFWAASFLAAFAGLLLFGFMFGFDLPLADAAFWTLPKNDMVAMVTAYEAFLREPWGLPLTMVSGLLPEPVPITFADSIPWIALALKASALGEIFNPLGVFMLLSYALQALGMAALLRAMGVTRFLPALVGCLLALMVPTWIARQFGHIALSGHWIVLFSLALSVTVARRGLSAARVAGFAVLGAFATGVHAYHVVPVAACLGAALAAELAQQGRRALGRVLVSGVAVLASVLISAWLLGYGEGAGVSGGANALGLYSMNILAPVWPQASALFGQTWNGSWFDNSLDPNGGQVFEGFQYLGTGVLLGLIALELGVLIYLVRGGRPTRAQLLRWTPLAFAILVLFLWAVGWIGYLGYWKLYSLPRPSGAVGEVLGLFRAHGRLFWAGTYLLTALVVVWAARLPRGWSAAALIAIAALQAYDTSELRMAVQETFASPEIASYPAGLEAAPALRGRPWVFVPSYFCSPSMGDQRAISQMNLMIVRSGGTTNTFATARSKEAACDQLTPDYMSDAGPHDPRITVVTGNDRFEGGPLEPIAARNDCYRFKRGAICGNGLDGIEGLMKVEAGELSAESRTATAEVRMDEGLKPPNLVSGWSIPDPGAKGIWSDGHKAIATIIAPPVFNASGAVVVEFGAIAFSDAPLRPQAVAVSANGRHVADLAIEPTGFNPYRVNVPVNVVAPGQPIVLTFDIPDARSPRSDPRLLGIALQYLKVLN